MINEYSNISFIFFIPLDPDALANIYHTIMQYNCAVVKNSD